MPDATPTIHTLIRSYPLDASLLALVASQPPVLVVVDDVAVEHDKSQAFPLGPSEEGDVPVMGTSTPARASVIEDLAGTTSLGGITIILPGGNVDGLSVKTEDDPLGGVDSARLGDRFLIGGRWVSSPDFGAVLEPHFLYRLDGETATSLLGSAGNDPHPSFPLGELRKLLAGR